MRNRHTAHRRLHDARPPPSLDICVTRYPPTAASGPTWTCSKSSDGARSLLRVYLGTDADTGRERWATTTVHGSRRHAQTQLALFAEATPTPGYALARSATCWTAGWPRHRPAGLHQPCGRLARSRLPSAPAPRPSGGGEADDRRHRRLLRAPAPRGRVQRPAARAGNRAPGPRRAAPRARPSGPRGVDLAQPRPVPRDRPASHRPRSAHPARPRSR